MMPKRAMRTVRWRDEPEMDAWMGAHDAGQPVPELSEAFAAEFGFALTRAQITMWRAINGRQTRRSPRRIESVPIGTERVSRGHVYVKVAMAATVPMSKDNWRPKSHLAWERAHGEPLPEGCVVMHGDRDVLNFDPANLVAVPRAYVARVNSPGGPPWSDGPALEARLAYERLRSGIQAAEARRERPCGVCGRLFAPSAADVALGMVRVKTCPECRAAGLKTTGARDAGRAVCEACGREYTRLMRTQRICSDCQPPCIKARRKRPRERN